MKIGVFGGAFNPPHIGHVNAAGKAIADYKLDLLIVIPTGTSPHKKMPEGTPTPDIRLKMAENAFGVLGPNVITSQIEIFSEISNYTIDTIKALDKEYSKHDKKNAFYLLVGNDMYDSLDTWKDSEQLLKIVTPVLLDRDEINISSTEIRKMLPLRDGNMYVSEANYSLIIRNKLYGAKPNWDWLRERAFAMLDDKRIAHVRGCEEAAVELAERWGENKDDAKTAAILHDITKKLDFNENMCIIAENGLVTNGYNIEEQKLLHSLTASLLAKSHFGASDNVAKAILLHTTGDTGMSMLDKIIYIADYIEPNRDFDGVEKLRQAAFEDINKAMIMGLQMSADDLRSRGIPVNKATINALNELTRSLNA